MGRWDDLFAEPVKPQSAPTMNRGPKQLTDEEAGVMSGPLKTGGENFGPARVIPHGDKPYPVTMGPEEIRALPASTWDMTKEQRQGFVSSLAPEDAAQVAAEERGDFVRFLASGAAGGIAGAGAGAAAGTVAPRLAPVAASAIAGGTASKVGGGDFTTGAGVGALVGAPGALLGVGKATLKARRAAGTMSDIGNMPGADKESLARLGAQRVDDIARRFGVVGAPDAVTAHANVRKGVNSVGADIGKMYDTIGDAGARPLGSLMQRMNDAQERLRTTRAGTKIADAIHEEMADLFEVHGGNKNATVKLGTLNREMQDSARVGYSGAKYGALEPKGQAVVQREIADILESELDAGLAVAAQDPKLAAVVKARDALNADYHALKVLDDTMAKVSVKSQFRRDPTARERAAEVPLLGKLAGKPQPSSTRQIAMPTGRSTGPVAGPAQPAPMTMSPGMAAAMSGGDEEAKRSALASELFGR